MFHELIYALYILRILLLYELAIFLFSNLMIVSRSGLCQLFSVSVVQDASQSFIMHNRDSMKRRRPACVQHARHKPERRRDHFYQGVIPIERR